MKSFPFFHFINLFFLLSTRSLCLAQTEKLRFENMAVEDGLSDDNVWNILQDRQGYLWFGSMNGLDKYDGYNFTTYKFNPHDPASISENTIFILWEDKKGVLWTGTTESGINKFDPKTEQFTSYQPPHPKGSFVPALTNVSAMNEDEEGIIWVGTFLGELRRFNRQTGQFSKNYDLGYNEKFDSDKDGHDQIHCIYKDRSGTLWFGNESGLHQLRINPGKDAQTSKISFTHYQHDPTNSNSLTDNEVRAIYEDSKGIFWIGTANGGLNRLDPKSGKFTHYLHDLKNPYSLSNNSLWHQSIVEDLEGNLWVGTFHGLNKLNPEQTKFERYFYDGRNPTGLADNWITTVFVDKAGSVWVGTNGGGISKVNLNQKPFEYYHHNSDDSNSLSSNSVSAIYEDKSGIVWLGTHGGGLNAFNRKKGTFRHFRIKPTKSKTIVADYIGGILEDKRGNFWIAVDDRILLFDRKTGKFSTTSGNAALDKSLKNSHILTLFHDSQGLLWVGTHAGLIRVDQVTGVITRYMPNPKDPESIADQLVSCIYEDKKGNLWIGHGSIATSKLNKSTGKFTRYSHQKNNPKSIGSNIVKTIYQDSRGTLWFGTAGGGLSKFNDADDSFTTYTEKHGLVNNSVYSILEDNKGNFWLGTGKGISMFSPTLLTFTNYYAEDGLQITQFTPAAFKGQDGTLYFGSKKGFNAFNPSTISSNKFIPPIVITQVKLFDKLLPGKNQAQEIELTYKQNFLSFEFAALNYTNSVKNQYAYRLEGMDPDWVYSGTRRYTSYTNLNPGTYVFRVKGSNNDGIWNATGTLLKIIIRPPWWRTWWAYAIYGLLFLVGIIAVDRLQRQRLILREREKAKERELEQAHEIEKAYHELKRTQKQLLQREKMASLGELTAGIAHEIQNPLNFVNNFSEVSTELVEELKQEIITEHKSEALELAKDLTQNLQKITLHGQRAGAIVKGMLQHARTSSGEKQLTDINALADEYLRLSYHGLRAKDQEFITSLITDFESSIKKVEVVPQEIGRVLLNLYNNAFYATQQKKSQLNGQYQPEVKVSTSCHDRKIEIRVRDNGCGIPEVVKDKIFQPFFTTKPTGQGTGLGLSLSYDIITKGHGGELKVETKEGDFTEFIISLPVQENY